MRLIMAHSPEIPLWPQLPNNPGEGMIRQFLNGFPGLVDEGSKHWIDTASPGYTAEMTTFYEDYLESVASAKIARKSRFGLSGETAKGFFVLEETLSGDNIHPLTIKGQITGPVTIGIGTRDENGACILYHDDLRDMLVKFLGLKARWQVEQLKRFTSRIPPIVLIDEPGMVSFSSTAFAGVSAEMVTSSVAGVIDEIKHAGGLSGIHICANGDWGPALSSDADIISFDAYSFFDNFILYCEQLITYLNRGGILAWGIVPTGNPQDIDRETVDHLHEMWRGQVQTMAELGISKDALMKQTLIAPSCGTGSLSLPRAEKVLGMVASLSSKIRAAG